MQIYSNVIVDFSFLTKGARTKRATPEMKNINCNKEDK
ncbi:hypothetical protein OIU78_023505 [Salix suchowensis]|nr:hypothetical protein OIU78_023505 [Salix suchowensis]